MKSQAKARAVGLSRYLTPAAKWGIAAFYGMSVCVVIIAPYEEANILSTLLLGIQGILVVALFLNVNRRLSTIEGPAMMTNACLLGVLIIGLVLSASSRVPVDSEQTREFRYAVALLPFFEGAVVLSALILLPWIARKKTIARHAERLRARLLYRNHSDDSTTKEITL